MEKGDFWKILLFKDEHNFAGIWEMADPERNKLNFVRQKWNIVEFLPQACEKIALVLVAEYIKAVYEKVRTLHDTEEEYKEEKIINIKLDTLDKMHEIEQQQEKIDV